MRRNLTNLIIAAGVLLVVTACFCPTSRDYGVSESNTQPANSVSAPSTSDNKSTVAKNPDDGDFIVEHLEVSTPRYAEIDRQVQNEKILVKAALKLNRSLILPHDIFLRTKDCNETNAFYDSRDQSVTMCYERRCCMNTVTDAVRWQDFSCDEKESQIPRPQLERL